jgi:hypothetical protein
MSLTGQICYGERPRAHSALRSSGFHSDVYPQRMAALLISTGAFAQVPVDPNNPNENVTVEYKSASRFLVRSPCSARFYFWKVNNPCSAFPSTVTTIGETQ